MGSMAAPTNINVEEFQETSDFTFNLLSTPLPHSMPPPPPLSDLAPNQQLADNVDEFSLFADMVDEFNWGEFPRLADNVGEFSLAASQRLTDNVDVPFGFSTRESMILPQQQQELLGYSSDASDFSADTDLSGATDMSVATDLGGATEDDEVGEVEKGKMKEKTPSSKILKFPRKISFDRYLIANQQVANNVGEFHPAANQQLADNVGEFSLAANQQLADNVDLPFWWRDNVGEFSLAANQQLADNVDLPFRESMILPQQQQEPLGYLSDASDFSAATDMSGATDMSVATDLDGATGDDEVGIRVEGTGVLGEMEDGQLNSRCLEKGKMKEKTSGGGEGNKKTTGVKIAIPLEDILLKKEMTIKDAAKHLKVGRSTLKRACREYGIYRWPPRTETNLDGTLSVSQLKSHKLTPSNQVLATIDTNSVIVKARYEDFTIKFKLFRPWPMVELEKEVEMRLELKAGTYYINYKDEDNDSILIACDADLQHCISSSRQHGTTSIEMNLYSKVIKTENFQEPFFTGKQLKDERLKLIIFIPSKMITFELQAKNHETVENIKLLIQLKKGILPEQYSLFYRGQLLEDNKTLASLNIQSESVLLLVFNPRDVMSVSVKMPSGEILKLEVKALHTIHDVKAIIESMVGFAASNQNLTYEGRQVDDSRTLACYNIKENSLLEMLPLPGLPFPIFVRDLAGKTIALNVFKEDRVRDVKKKILDERRLPVWVNNFHLVFGRHLLEEDRDLASYNVEKDATLHVVYGADASSEDHIQP